MYLITTHNPAIWGLKGIPSRERSHIPPGEVEKIIHSKSAGNGKGYVIVPRRVSSESLVRRFHICHLICTMGSKDPSSLSSAMVGLSSPINPRQTSMTMANQHVY